MAVLSMKKVNICGLKKDRKPILETLQRLGMMEVCDLFDDQNSLTKIDTFGMRAIFEKNKNIAQNALEILERYLPENKPFLQNIFAQNEISKKDYYIFANESEEIMRVSNEIVRLSRSITEKKSEIIRIKAKIKSLSVWKSLDIPMSFSGTKKTKTFVGTFPFNIDEAGIKSFLAESLIDESRYDLEVLYKSDEQSCVFILCHFEAAEKILEVLRKNEFAWPIFCSDEIPSLKINEFLSEIKNLETQILKAEKEIKSYNGQKNAIKFVIDYHKMRSEKYDVISRLLHSKNFFILTGFVPQKYAKKLESKLSSKFDIAIDFLNPCEEDNVPVMLKNNGLASPVESVLESYSLPGRGEIDPTSIMAIFYYILFGMMLSDAAYGFIIVAVCGYILAKYKNIKTGIKNTLKMFMFCGISTTFWGVLFGSYFGDAVEVISTTFFNLPLKLPALWFVPLNEPMRMLAFSFGIGIIHLFAGLFLQGYELFCAKKLKDIFYDVVSWYFLVGGIIIYMLSESMITAMLGINFVLPTIVGEIGIILAVFGAFLILLTAGRESKSPFKRFLKGLYGLYGVTGYLSDILSYSRLLALGLATGVIAQVFNKMGTMAGNGFVGAILFIVVFLIGHTMNIAINLLGAYVHTNRLQFVEFFSKFYKGGGRKFSPFFVNTKYFKVTEDIYNE